MQNLPLFSITSTPFHHNGRHFSNIQKRILLAVFASHGDHLHFDFNAPAAGTGLPAQCVTLLLMGGCRADSSPVWGGELLAPGEPCWGNGSGQLELGPLVPWLRNMARPCGISPSSRSELCFLAKMQPHMFIQHIYLCLFAVISARLANIFVSYNSCDFLQL